VLVTPVSVPVAPPVTPVSVLVALAVTVLSVLVALPVTVLSVLVALPVRLVTPSTATPVTVFVTPPTTVLTVPVTLWPALVEPGPDVLAVRVPPPASCNASRSEMSFTSALSAAVLAAGAFFGTRLKSEARLDAPSFVIFSGAGTG